MLTIRREPFGPGRGLGFLLAWLVFACSEAEPNSSAGERGGSSSGGASGSGATGAGTSSGGSQAGTFAGGASGVAGIGAAGASAGVGNGGVSSGGGAGAGNAGSGGGGANAAGAGSNAGGGAGRAGMGGAGSGGVAGAGQGGTGGAGNGGSAGATCELGTTFQWTSSAPLVVPKSDAAHNLVAVKDPTVVRFGDRFHVYASSVTTTGVYGTVQTSFTDWSQAPNAPLYYMDQTPGFNTYTAAPQLFYFTPQNRWYLVFQSGPPMYSTSDNPGDPTRWTRPAPFYAAEPPIITQNGGWLDFWVICDTAYCHLFFSDDHGRWYKSRTAIGNFPNGFGTPVVVMQDAEAGRLFEGSSVYKVRGTNKYLALVEAFDGTSNWRRYFRSWTSESLEGPWTALRDSGTSPFVGPGNVAFEGTAWTNDVSHGELVRSGHDETMPLDACHLEFIYQGFDPAADTTDYNKIPWRIALLRAR